MSRHRHQRGFTLLEVLIATVIIATALGAIIQSTTVATSNLAYLRDKTFAHWVALNQFAELQIKGQYPAIGKTRGKAEMGGRQWYWRREIKATTDKDMRRVEIRVSIEDSEKAGSLASITGFMTRYNVPGPARPAGSNPAQGREQGSGTGTGKTRRPAPAQKRATDQ